VTRATCIIVSHFHANNLFVYLVCPAILSVAEKTQTNETHSCLPESILLDDRSLWTPNSDKHFLTITIRKDVCTYPYYLFSMKSCSNISFLLHDAGTHSAYLLRQHGWVFVHHTPVLYQNG